MRATEGLRAHIGAAFQARVRYEEPMSAHSSWHAGGAAEAYFSPRDADDLAAFLRALPPSVPVYWVGLGTNLLVRAGGLRGVVVATGGVFTRIERAAERRIDCGASVPCARIARACTRWQLGGGEFFGGIPGLLGGALAMNAGAFGDETWRHVVSVTTMDRCGRSRARSREEFSVGYREVALADTAPRAATLGIDEWFISAQLEFPPQVAASDEVGGIASGERMGRLQELLTRRRETQPLGAWSCGSVFKNPPGDHAARLIEAADLKGYRIGDAVVSEKHANFIINCGRASATDLEQLIQHVQATVLRTHGVALEPEVRIIGDAVASASEGATC